MFRRLAERYLVDRGYRVIRPVDPPPAGTSWEPENGGFGRRVLVADGTTVLYAAAGDPLLTPHLISADTWHRWVRRVRAKASA